MLYVEPRNMFQEDQIYVNQLRMGNIYTHEWVFQVSTHIISFSLKISEIQTIQIPTTGNFSEEEEFWQHKYL